MKKIIVSMIAIIFLWSFLPSCIRSGSDVGEITISIDPNELEGDVSFRKIYSVDSIANFMEMLDTRKKEPVKFYPQYAIDINRSGNIERYLGSSQYIKDARGQSYEVLARNWMVWISK